MSTFTEIAAVIKSAFEAEFAAENFTLTYDELHESLGASKWVAGIAPVEESISSRDNYVKETYVTVSLFGRWDKVVDPTQKVDPSLITEYADRFLSAMRTLNDQPGTGRAWYFNVERIEYPRDPTGNKTRFVATLCCYGNNSQLIETV
jgi:hypothetical protein